MPRIRAALVVLVATLLAPTATALMPGIGAAHVHFEKATYVFGGSELATPWDRVSTNIWRVDHDDNAVTQLDAVLPVAVRAAFAARAGDTIIGGGGSTAASVSFDITDVLWRFDPATERIEEIGALAVGVMHAGAVADAEGQVVVMGGDEACDSDPFRFCATDLIQTVGTDGQTTITGRLPVALSGFGTAHDRPTTWLIGGRSSDKAASPTMYAIDLETFDAQVLATDPRVARLHPILLPVDGGHLIIGGHDPNVAESRDILHWDGHELSPRTPLSFGAAGGSAHLDATGQLVVVGAQRSDCPVCGGIDIEREAGKRIDVHIPGALVLVGAAIAVLVGRRSHVPPQEE